MNGGLVYLRLILKSSSGVTLSSNGQHAFSRFNETSLLSVGVFWAIPCYIPVDFVISLKYP